MLSGTKSVDMRHILPISGKDSLATALVQTAREPDLPYELMFNPTGQELPEVFDWLEKVSRHFNKEIVFVGRDLKQIIVEQNWFLPSRLARYCTRMSKIEPMEKFIGKDEATVYYGIRADEDRGGFDNSASPNITPKYPLKASAVGIAEVYRIVSHFDLMPPMFFDQRLWEEATKVIPAEYIKKHFAPWVVAALFAWRTRLNCAMCFNQRLYEWVGLLWYHPEIFWEYESWEHNVSEYYFAGKDKPLKWVAENAEEIFQRRVKRLINFFKDTMQAKLFQPERKTVQLSPKERMLVNEMGTKMKQESAHVFDDEGFIDMLPITSCGLYCGK